MHAVVSLPPISLIPLGMKERSLTQYYPDPSRLIPCLLPSVQKHFLRGSLGRVETHRFQNGIVIIRVLNPFLGRPWMECLRDCGFSIFQREQEHQEGEIYAGRNRKNEVQIKRSIQRLKGSLLPQAIEIIEVSDVRMEGELF